MTSIYKLQLGGPRCGTQGADGWVSLEWEGVLRWSRPWLARGARAEGLPAPGACASEPEHRPAPALPEDQGSSGGKKHTCPPALAGPGVRS